MLPLVIGRDADVNIPHGGISVAKGNGRDVTKSSFLDRLHTNHNSQIYKNR